jgi:hypothetical protein
MGMMEALEARRLMAVVVTLTHTGTLMISGSEQDDVVDLYRAAVNKIRVMASGAVSDFDRAAVKRIVGTMRGGNDHVFAHGGIGRRMNIDGGDGDDVLHGGSHDDSLAGGDGNDYLFGGQGHDTLIGGAGRDRLDAADEGGLDPGFSPGAWSDFVDGDDQDNDLILHDPYDRLHIHLDTVLSGNEASFQHLRGATEWTPGVGILLPIEPWDGGPIVPIGH